MNRLNLLVSGVAVVLLVAAGAYSSLGYSGNDAIASHYMTKGEWSDSVCGGCHFDVYENVNNSYHVQVNMSRWSPLTNFDLETSGEEEWVKEFGMYHPGGGPLAKYGIDIDCMMCHEKYGLYDFDARAEAIANGDFANANSLAVANFSATAQTDPLHLFVYAANVLTPYPLLIVFHDAVNGAPTSCAQMCHRTDVETSAVMWADEEAFEESDAHAANGVECTACHHTEAFIITSDHQIGRGNASDSPDLPDSHYDDTMRSCDDAACHAGISHGPFADSHMEFLACEACHIPELPGGDLPGGNVLESFSWQNGEREDVYRDSDFQPALAWYNGNSGDVLPSVDTRNDTDVMVTPFNNITGTWWDAGTDPEVLANPNTSISTGDPIPVQYVKAADANGDGEVTVEEMQAYDADGDGQADYPNAVLRTVELYYQVAHSIVSSDIGLADPYTCKDCHGNESVIDWAALGYEQDPGGESSAVKSIAVTYDRPRPVEVEREPAL
ncbi:methanogenesis multiheme c-type cytochrome [Methanosarcina siciliae]|uniref:methanogenesis multiheme c-type cytochrome n=1 Tax=Methanosarcina siciliae TaxID=38027 RepID=UPI000AFD9E36|nr:methanogenesis multiheme c-type cytochrome [Methanosarcina siciliae]